MANKQEKVEYTAEEKALFLVNNTKINFWIDKTLIKEFDQLAKQKGLSRKDAITKLITKFVAKNTK